MTEITKEQGVIIASVSLVVVGLVNWVAKLRKDYIVQRDAQRIATLKQIELRKQIEYLNLLKKLVEENHQSGKSQPQKTT